MHVKSLKTRIINYYAKIQLVTLVNQHCRRTVHGILSTPIDFIKRVFSLNIASD